MSFQAYLTNIEAKTGKNSSELRALAAEKGFTADDTLKPGARRGRSWTG
jgi:hypothetical protein